MICLTSACVTKYVPTNPTPCRISAHPTPPDPGSILPCSLDGTERVCVSTQYFDDLATYFRQLKRWRDEVRTCRQIKEDRFTSLSRPYKATMYKLMESF